MTQHEFRKQSNGLMRIEVLIVVIEQIKQNYYVNILLCGCFLKTIKWRCNNHSMVETCNFEENIMIFSVISSFLRLIFSSEICFSVDSPFLLLFFFLIWREFHLAERSSKFPVCCGFMFDNLNLSLINVQYKYSRTSQ